MIIEITNFLKVRILLVFKINLLIQNMIIIIIINFIEILRKLKLRRKEGSINKYKLKYKRYNNDRMSISFVFLDIFFI